MFNYIDYLSEQLNTLKYTISENYPELENVDILVEDEQAFMDEVYKTNLILVIVKQLSSSITYEGKTQPIQLTIVADDNTIDHAKTLFNEFTATYNWRVETFADKTGATFVKQQYSSPVVMSNFSDVGIGYKSLLYIPATLFITEEVIDLHDFIIDDIAVQPIDFQLNYAMNGDTQPVGGSRLASTVKSTATLSMSFSLPCKKYAKKTPSIYGFTRIDGEEVLHINLSEYTPTFIKEYQKFEVVSIRGVDNFEYDDTTTTVTFINPDTSFEIRVNIITLFTSKVLSISNGTTSGNSNFAVSFSIGDVPFNFNLKLSTMGFITAPNAIPALNLGFMV